MYTQFLVAAVLALVLAVSAAHVPVAPRDITNPKQVSSQWFIDEEKKRDLTDGVGANFAGLARMGVEV
ncbi:hypothetical protein EXIGLDRAFT_768742 [Exidia glandulosa HHB12029]|uniref:Uncharacterized protein n=1 Tax=Exidia glandulosa HHB12029 TaxID=1314781 RepID=A0A165I0P7_EXIGL|nr:hypothetical protein EXIGLDRAFT_768742 [Exidia glandulosa HHB12029]